MCWVALIAALLTTSVNADEVFVNGMGIRKCSEANSWANDQAFRAYLTEWVGGYTAALAYENIRDFRPGDVEYIVDNVFWECRRRADETPIVQIVRGLSWGFPKKMR